MRKRIISLLLVLALLPMCLAVPVLAEEFVDGTIWINALDFTTVDNSGSNFFDVYSNRTIDISLSSMQIVGNVDFLLYSTSPIVSVSVLHGSGTVFDLTVINVSDKLYRITGDLSQYGFYSLPVTITTNTSSVAYCELLSFKYSSLSYFFSNISVSATINAMGFPNQIFNTSFPDSAYCNWSYDSYEHYEGANTFGMFRSDFRFSDWRKYDYVELQLGLVVAEIDSVSAYIGEQIVPLDVSYIENADQVGNYYLHIRADLTGFDRNSTNSLFIVVNGAGHFQLVNQVNIFDACGLVVVPEPSLWNYWFTNLQNWLSSGFSSLTSGLATLGTNIGSYISSQTSAFTSALVSHQQSLIAAEQAQQEANRQLMNTISSNVGIWISNQTNTIVSSITSLGANISHWFTTQTNALTSSIGSWGQSLKDSIDALPDKIAEALKDLVVPQDGAIESMATKSEELVSNRFGGVFEGAQIVDNWASQLRSQAATQILTVPVVEMNILGKIFPLGGWEVDLVPDGFEIIFESVKIIIDILATAAFINGVKFRLERTLEK